MSPRPAVSHRHSTPIAVTNSGSLLSLGISGALPSTPLPTPTTTTTTTATATTAATTTATTTATATTATATTATATTATTTPLSMASYPNSTCYPTPASATATNHSPRTLPQTATSWNEGPLLSLSTISSEPCYSDYPHYLHYPYHPHYAHHPSRPVSEPELVGIRATTSALHSIASTM